MTPDQSAQTTILVADDDPDLRDILRTILEPSGFRVEEAADGQSALDAVRLHRPDLLILDYMMPGLTGPQVCAKLKQDVVLRHVPIIMLTGKGELHDKVFGINSGADDYVVKPFEPQELLARVQMVLRRSLQDLEANPLTQLPGNISIQQELQRRLDVAGPIAVCYIDLDRFKMFNDHYGFKRGDDVIQRTALILLEALRDKGNVDDFLGHIGGDDFLIITTPNRADSLCNMIIKEFDAMAAQLYDEKDRARGYLLHTDRKGKSVKIPFLSISIALVTNEEHPLTHPGQVATIGAELKAYAKQFDRSIYVRERRKTAS